MYSEIINPRFEKGKYWDTWGDDVSEDLEGYWVLGIAYLVMDFVSIFLIFGGIVVTISKNEIWLINS